MKKYICLGLTIILSGCITVGHTPEQQANMSAASDALQKCLESAIMRLDDGTSPANVIAQGAAGQCGGPHESWIEAMAAGQGPVYENTFREQDRLHYIDRVTGVVLEQRAKSRTSGY